jgi:hypothetical protein
MLQIRAISPRYQLFNNLCARGKKAQLSTIPIFMWLSQYLYGGGNWFANQTNKRSLTYVEVGYEEKCWISR